MKIYTFLSYAPALLCSFALCMHGADTNLLTSSSATSTQ